MQRDVDRKTLTSPLRLALPFGDPAARPVLLHALGGLRLTSATGSADLAADDAGGVGSAAAGTTAGAFEGRFHVQAVLALAGASSTGIARDELVDVLWPKSGVAAGRNRVYHSVHLARQAVSALSWDDEWLVVRHGRVLLDPRVWSDVLALERAAQGQLSALSSEEFHALLPLCESPWMPELDVGLPGERVRARVRSQQTAVLREAVLRVRGNGDSPALRAHLHSLLHLEPTDEPSYRELMQLDLRAGRWHAVLRSFEKINRELNVQLGLRPTAQTSAIAVSAAARLQQRESQPGWHEFGAAQLVGREPLVHGLVEQLTQRPGVWNLTGLSGVGKTSVVHEVARRLAPGMPDGVVIVALGDLAAHDSATAACVRALGITPSQQSDELDLLAEAMRVRHMLLVLDDLDAAADAQALLAALPTLMRARVFVISTAPLPGQPGVHVPVPPLDAPATGVSLEQAKHSASYALFVMRCAVTGPEQQSPAWQRDVVQLVNRLDGLPLAIELAAARVATLTPGEILQQIERNLEPLNNGPADLVARHRSVQSSLDWSVRMLSAPARAAYAVVAVFAGSFVPPEVGALAVSVGMDKTALLGALDELLAAGLLSSAVDGDRLRVLHLPRRHARGLAQHSGSWDAIVAAHLHEVCRRMGGLLAHNESPLCATQQRQIVHLEEEAVALLEYARLRHADLFLRLVLPLCESWNTRGLSSAALHWVELGVQVARTLGDRHSELRLHTIRTVVLRRAGGLVDAERVSQHMAALIEAVDDASVVAHAAAAWARALEATGQAQRGVALCLRTIARLQLRPQDSGFWTAYEPVLAMRGSLPNVNFDLESLRERFAGSLLWMSLVDTAGVLNADHGPLDRQMAYAEEIIAASQGLHQHRFVLHGIWRKAMCQLAMDDVAQAMHTLQSHFRLARRIAWDTGAVCDMLMMAVLHLYRDDLQGARDCYTAALASSRHAGAELLTVCLPLMNARILAHAGHAERAQQEFCALPSDWLERVKDQTLTEWAETAAVLAGLLDQGHVASALAADLRLLSLAADRMPVVRQFRDQRFGPALTIHPLQPPQAEDRESLRLRLRGRLLHFSQSLSVPHNA